MSDKSLDKFFVRGADGALDKTATLQKFEVAMEERNTYLVETFGKINSAMLGVIHKYPDAKLGCSFIVGETMRALNPAMKDYTETEGHCKDFLQYLKTSGVVEISKGPTGGCKLIQKSDASTVPAAPKELPAIEISTASGSPVVVDSTDSE